MMKNDSTKYKLAVFDMDGTILDTLEDIAAATNYALKQNNLPLREIKEVQQFVGNGIHKLIERAVPANTPDSLIDRVFTDFNTFYKEHCQDNTKPYEGIIEAIWELKKHGMLVAVISNKADYAVQDLCDRYFPEVFDYAAGERKGIPKKPAPDSVYAILAKFKVEKSRAVYIGDSEVDIETAKNSGIDEIAVSWGFKSKEFLVQNKATTIVENTRDLLKTLLTE